MGRGGERWGVAKNVPMYQYTSVHIVAGLALRLIAGQMF